MTLIPFRELATKGILTDPSPYELDLQSWSGGSNVRFDSQKAMRAPVWRSVFAGLPAAPAFIFAYTPSSGLDQVMVTAGDGTTQSYQDGTLTVVTPSGFTPLTGLPVAFNSTVLGDVVYLNNPAMVPQYYGPTSTGLLNLPAWDAGWRARSLRAFGDYVLAFNVTKGGVAFPNMVKWSNLTLYGQPPDSWDADDQTTTAGENPLEGLISPLVDGAMLGNAMIAYSEDQIWAIQQTGTQSIFEFTQLFSEGGLIAPNCVVEVNGNHYVFGVNDIYMHNGTTKTSLASQRVKNFVYRNLSLAHTERCFVHHMPATTEIMFGFVSQDPDAYWQNPQGGCNRCVVYNYTTDTFAPGDLPGIVGMTRADVVATLTFAEAAMTFADIGGSYADLLQGFQRSDIAANVSPNPGGSIGVPEAIGMQILAYDFANKGSLQYTIDPTCNAPAVLVKQGIDLDNAGSDLQTYKAVKRIYPQVVTFGEPLEPIVIDIGSQLYSSSPLTYVPSVNFDPTSQYKVDLRKGGRYLSITFTVSSLVDFEIAGFDLDTFAAGRR